MLFKDYFKNTDSIQKEEDKKRKQSQKLYDFYVEYATKKLDDYSKEPTIWVTVKGFNFIDGCIDTLDTINIYGPKCFQNAGVMLMLLHSGKIAQVWNTHTFIDGKEVEPLKIDYWKPIYKSYAKLYKFLDAKY